MKVRRKEDVEDEWIQELESRKNQLVETRPKHMVEGNSSEISMGEKVPYMPIRRGNEMRNTKSILKDKKEFTKAYRKSIKK